MLFKNCVGAPYGVDDDYLVIDDLKLHKSRVKKVIMTAMWGWFGITVVYDEGQDTLCIYDGEFYRDSPYTKDFTRDVDIFEQELKQLGIPCEQETVI
ncbi:hypothetical protein KVG29_05250 [Caldicoprobacter algeriensis]|uniref:hypothetical protein n=1 Tax=Caldicoprobacter algeriensis TaxID=699281 RepID=UPI00207A1D05|nr:hypothetical protein [Caldicoprobacter algeriensis]MCM8900635.1 hypothetical protein [Caldicoprobacter algeriensis]